MENMIAPGKSLDERIIACQTCPRLVAWREEVAQKKRRAYADWDYWGKPVPGFGDRNGRLAVIGLAPGAHGANRTGRVFTGDDSGRFLFSALYRAGFASQPESLYAGDGLALNDVFITAVCRCAPPDNKPTTGELLACRPFLEEDLRLLPNLQGIVLLGKIAMDSLAGLYRSRGVALPPLDFGHGRLFQIGEGQPWWLTSYHPSRQNTQTGRLTAGMFDEIWDKARDLLEK